LKEASAFVRTYTCLPVWTPPWGPRLGLQAVIGVDPHTYVLTAVALDARGGVLGRLLGRWSGGASGAGVRALRAWAAAQAPGAAWTIEGSNRLGRRLAVLVAADGSDVRDVLSARPARPVQAGGRPSGARRAPPRVLPRGPSRTDFSRPIAVPRGRAVREWGR
jgi:hypothetical protein